MRTLEAENWLPQRLLWVSPLAALGWIGKDLVRLAELGDWTGPTKALQLDEFVVTPSGVDHDTARVRKLGKSMGLVGFRSEEIEIGDVMVPALPQSPCVFVQKDLLEVGFSGAYFRFRADERRALAVWGVLNSTHGVKLRRSAISEGMHRQAALRDLVEIEVPADVEILAGDFRAVLPKSSIEYYAEPTRSRWLRGIFLNEDTWLPKRLFAQKDYSGEVALSNYFDFWTPSATARKALDFRAEGTVPVVTPRQLSNGVDPEKWIHQDEVKRTTTDRTLLVQKVGPLRIFQPGAGVCPSEMFVAMDPKAETPSWVETRTAAFLNSPRGELALVASGARVGTSVPMVSRKGLSETKIPDPIDLPEPESEPVERSTLSTRLAHIVEARWS